MFSLFKILIRPREMSRRVEMIYVLMLPLSLVRCLWHIPDHINDGFHISARYYFNQICDQKWQLMLTTQSPAVTTRTTKSNTHNL